ncbi:hypothetical protein HA402_001343 [Bradysia odoriphaga]|nr:hypothetical protein HA402_001343 [Bradysia odoriphaga]
MKLAILFVIVCTIPALEAIRCHICRKPDGSCRNIIANENLNVVECPYGLPTCGTVSKVVNGQNITTAYDCYPQWDDACTTMNGGMDIHTTRHDKSQTMRTVIFLVIACALPALEATKCYQCEEINPDSGTCINIDKVKLVECPSQMPTCGIGTMVINGQNVTVAYSCFPKMDNKCLTQLEGSVCFCNQDGCNSPPKGESKGKNDQKNDSKILYSSIGVVTISALFLHFVRNCY